MKRRALAVAGLAAVVAVAAIAQAQRATASTPARPAARPADFGEIATPRIEQLDPSENPGARPADPPVAAAIDPPPARFSTHREVGPFDEIDRAVGLEGEARAKVLTLVVEREARMTESYAEAVSSGGDRQAAIDDVRRIYAAYEAEIVATLTADQRARYDAARRAGRIGAPMFVFRYGGDSTR
jgi:hypothetical protein